MAYAALAERACAVCARPFVPHTPKGRYCGRQCFADAQRQLMTTGPKPIKFCKSCGDPFKQIGPRQLHCRKPVCHWKDHEERVLKPWRESQARQHALREFFEAKRQVVRILRGKEQFGSDGWRSEREHRLRREIEEVLAENQELALLVSEQERDARWGNRTFGISLDQFVSEDAYLGDFVTANDDLDEVPFQAKFASGRGFSNAWTEVVHHRIDRAREIDAWAEAA